MANANRIYDIYKIMSNEMNNPKIAVCPADERVAASDFTFTANAAVSYFVGKDCDETFPAQILSGDRNICKDVGSAVSLNPLSAYGYSPPDGVKGNVLGFGTNLNNPNSAPVPTQGWSVKMHNSAGDIGLSDGSVQNVTTGGLRTYFSRSGDINSPPNVLLFP